MYPSRTSRARPSLRTSTEVVQESQPTNPPTASPPRSATGSPSLSLSLPESTLLPFSAPAEAWWQAVLFVDGRSTGRLVAPEIAWEPSKDSVEADEGHGLTVGQLSLHFSRIVPARTAGASVSPPGSTQQHLQERTQPLCLPVDECFAKRSYRVQVFGREQQGVGASVAVPHAFQAHGRELNAALNVQRQWQEYQQRHQAARTSAGQPVSNANFAHSSTLPVQSGDGLDHLQAIFDVATRPAWLKGIICRFLVAGPSDPSHETAPLDGSGSSGAGKTERGGTAVAGAPALVSGSMAASAAVQAGSAAGTGSASCVPANPRRQESQDQRCEGQEEQCAPDEQRQQQAQAPAAQAAGNEGAAASAQQPPAGGKEGKAKRSNAARKQRKALALAAERAAEQGRRSAEPCPAEPGQHPSSSKGSGAAGSRAISSSSRSQPASAAQPTSTAAGSGSRGKGPAGGKPWQQSAAQHATGVTLSPSMAGQDKGSVERSQTSSRSQPSSRQDVTVVRRHPSLFPAAVAQQQQVAEGNSGLLPAASDCSNAASGFAASASVPSSMPLSREVERGIAAEERTVSSPAACSGTPASAEAGVGRGHIRGCRGRGVVAARGSTELPASPRLPAVSGAPAAPEVLVPVPAQLATSSAASAQLSEVQLLAADLSGVAPEAATACLCRCGCGQPTAAVAAAAAAPPADVSSRSKSSCAPRTQHVNAAWQGAATTADVAIGSVAALPTARLSVEASSSVGSAAGASTPGGSSSLSAWLVQEDKEKVVGGCELASEVSDASVGSWHSDAPYLPPSRPSDYGLPYNFGHHVPLPHHWEPRGLTAPAHTFGQHSGPPSPQQVAPLRDAGLRHVRRSTGSFGNNKSMSLAGSGGFYAAPPAALHHAQHAASMPLLPLPGYRHHRSASSSSSSSHSGGSMGEGASPQLANPAGMPRWQGSMPASWADPYSPHHHPQLYMHAEVPTPPPSHVPRSRSMTGMQQWAQPSQPGSGPAAEAHRHLRRGRQQQQTHTEAAMQYKSPPPLSPAPAVHGGASSGSGSGSGGNCVGSPVLASSSYTPRSAPTSTGSSPLVTQGQPAGQPSKTPPPPQLLAAPVLDLQVPESVEDSPDLERFMQAATPQVVPPPTGVQDLTLADLWRWYEEPSTVGCEVTMIGGPRGPATAYYLPYLSAVQLLAPVSAADEAAVLAAAAAALAGASTSAPPQLLSYPNGLDSWPERMRAAVQWAEDANMRDRVPLASRLADVCGEAGAAHPLMATRIADLHPFSWFAVAWYPLYCVPETPLTARFLTFHTLASLWDTASTAAAQRSQQQQQWLAAAASNAQQQWLASAEAAAAAEAGIGSERGHEGAADAPGAGAVSAAVSSPTAPPPRISYKSMLASGLPTAAERQPLLPATAACTATPTAVCSFPASPTCSDAGTRTTRDFRHASHGSRPHSLDWPVGSGASSATAGRSRLALSSGTRSLSPGAGGSVYEPLSLSLPPSSAATSTAPASPAASPPASEAEDSAEPLPVPVAGLTWYATGQEENWQETLVAAPLPEGIDTPPGTLVACGARLLGAWRGVAVLARSYPVAKGGPLGWEIQQEEMAQCAERLSAGAGLVALRPRLGAGGRPTGSWERLERLPAAALGVACPDYEFFASRAARYE